MVKKETARSLSMICMCFPSVYEINDFAKSFIIAGALENAKAITNRFVRK
jgi:hypothetical protein